jgi:hypothetical protein
MEESDHATSQRPAHPTRRVPAVHALKAGRVEDMHDVRG